MDAEPAAKAVERVTQIGAQLLLADIAQSSVASSGRAWR